ncbi:MAG: ankyrin repeat domain-containing protein, partial [Akkermansiaceae bacterium]|nr:ankyrin repeat domain-containing protein [Akkermansiaceae bacterium]
MKSVSILISFVLITANVLAQQPLLDAAMKNDSSAVKSLLENGTNPNERNYYGVTPLSLACR